MAKAKTKAPSNLSAIVALVTLGDAMKRHLVELRRVLRFMMEEKPASAAHALDRTVRALEAALKKQAEAAGYKAPRKRIKKAP